MHQVKNSESERDPRILEVSRSVPVGRVLVSGALTVGCVVVATIALSLMTNRTTLFEMLDVCSIVSIVIFIAGSLMWGRFPSLGHHSIDNIDAYRAMTDPDDMSTDSMLRGAVPMGSGVVCFFAAVCFSWVTV